MKMKTTKPILFFSVMSAATIFQGCAESEPANNARVSFNTNGVSNINANSAGVETMERDPNEVGRFKCKKGDEITLEFTKPNQNSTINYEYDAENKRRKVENDKLTFTCDKMKILHLLFNFAGSGGFFKTVFRAKSGAVINDEEPVTNPTSNIPETRHYTFLVK